MINKLLYFKSLLSHHYIINIIKKLENPKNDNNELDVMWYKFGYQYSYDEIENIKNLEKNDFFNLLTNIVDKILIYRNDKIHVEMSYILDWQNLVNNYGEELFVACRYSIEDKKNNIKRTNFNWLNKAKIYDNRFNSIMSKGLAENHFHLKGSGPVAQFNFLSLMNSDNYKKIFFNKENEQIYSNNTTCRMSFEELSFVVDIGRLLRKVLFLIVLQIKDNFNKEEKDNIKSYIKECVDLILESINQNKNLIKYHNFNNPFVNGLFIQIKRLCHNDYCCYYSNDNNILNGERALIYNILYDWDKMIMAYQNLFNLYLIIKTQIYKVFKQNNDKVGFANFKKYDALKDLFLTKKMKSEYLKYSYDILNENNNLSKIELRIAPKFSYKANINALIDIENQLNGCSYDYKHFFVYHFIKGRDNNCSIFLPRNYIQRNNARKQADIIIKTFSNIKNKNLIKGIDAANSELGCRPEVYGQTFRYLRNFTYFDSNTLSDRPITMNITYHVGEDFIDIIDGIRAIEEAVKFLDLSNGDRLGHCVALGTNAEKYYKFKNMNIVKTKQNALDDYVWMYEKMSEFGINEPAFQYRISNKIEQLINELYENSDKNIKIIDYYHSMQLRGDNPECYKNNTTNIGRYAHYDKNFNMENYDIYSSNDIAKELYRRYHYSQKTKLKGMEIIEINISNDYIKVVNLLQKGIKKFIYDKGICIETNPTSNYLIGPFNYYSDLPLLNFNRYILDSDSKYNIPVTVCTDDQGIFSTCLENEYAVIFKILTSQEYNDDNSKKYDKEIAYDYIDKLREYGIIYSFKK